MTFWEALGLIGFGAAVLGAWLTVASYYDGRRTRALMRDLAQHADQRHTDTQVMTRDLMADLQAKTRDLIREMQSETRLLLERMDERADERHREVIEAIRTLRA